MAAATGTRRVSCVDQKIVRDTHASPSSWALDTDTERVEVAERFWGVLLLTLAPGGSCFGRHSPSLAAASSLEH